jgi:NAD(P)-dependent dehydrogenase (short-subunit alcohol dehydrogenase family)
MKVKTVFITGVSSGIGHILAEAHIQRGDTVYGIGRHEAKSLISHPNFYFMPLDLRDADMVRDTLRPFVLNRSFDRVILNAGIYPKMQNMVDTPMETFRNAMNVNLWSHKNVIDTMLTHTQTQQIVALGATPELFNQKGMGAYAISKASLNAMIKIYAAEFSHVHFGSIAPELIQSPTLSALFHASDSKLYSVIQHLRDRPILSADQASPRLMDALEKIKYLKSGTFIEMKKLLDLDF